MPQRLYYDSGTHKHRIRLHIFRLWLRGLLLLLRSNLVCARLLHIKASNAPPRQEEGSSVLFVRGRDGGYKLTTSAGES